MKKSKHKLFSTEVTFEKPKFRCAPKISSNENEQPIFDLNNNTISGQMAGLGKQMNSFF